MTRQAAALIGLTAIVSFLLGLVAAGTTPDLPTSDFLVRSQGALVEPLVLAGRVSPVFAEPYFDGPVDFATVAAAVNTAVVNVDTASRGLDRPRPGRRYGGESGTREGSGSGFIIDPSGLILTNYHVIVGADRVTVTLGDGRAFRADVVGVDPAIDVALLKVRAPAPLPVVVLGDSETLRVGEWVCAIGNPLGVYVHSVTVGVVSFLGRKLFDQGLDAYIQTDAAISVGNSGGPLINARGQVVGITTAVSAQASNIGFAIPITQVIEVLPQLQAKGRVARGFLGVGLTSMTPALRQALRLDVDRGALVEDVPAERVSAREGLRPYDVVVTADGKAVHSDEELVRHVASRLPGTISSLEVWRDGRLETVAIKLRDRPLSDAVRRRALVSMKSAPAASLQAPLGITARDLDETAVRRLVLPDDLRGVLVAAVDPAGPARLAQIRMNQVIVEINRRPVRSMADYRAIAATLRAGDPAALLVYDRSTRQRAIYTVVADPFP
jgi:serine protease Do